MPIRDFSAWRCDAPEWVKKRQQGWKAVNKQLRGVFEKKDKDVLELLKAYYLTGTYPEDWGDGSESECYRDMPLTATYIGGCLFYECWLSADSSKDSWDQIFRAYAECAGFDGDQISLDYYVREGRKVLRNLIDYYPQEGSVLGGLEERLYRQFPPTRFRHQDFPNLLEHEEVYLGHAAIQYNQMGRVIQTILKGENANPHHIMQYMIQEWGDTIVSVQKYWLDKDPKEKVIRYCDFGEFAQWAKACVLHKADYEPVQYKVASAVIEQLELARAQLIPELAAKIDEGYALAEAERQGA